MLLRGSPWRSSLRTGAHFILHLCFFKLNIMLWPQWFSVVSRNESGQEKRKHSRANYPLCARKCSRLVEKSMSFGFTETWVQVWDLPLLSCANIGKLSNLSVPVFSSVKWKIEYLTSSGCRATEMRKYTSSNQQRISIQWILAILLLTT